MLWFHGRLSEDAESLGADAVVPMRWLMGRGLESAQGPWKVLGVLL